VNYCAGSCEVRLGFRTFLRCVTWHKVELCIARIHLAWDKQVVVDGMPPHQMSLLPVGPRQLSNVWHVILSACRTALGHIALPTCGTFF
jgi:hypothetical protein